MIALNRFALPLRIIQCVFGLITLALLAKFVSTWHNFYTISVPGEAAFLLFCGLWGFILAPALYFLEKRQETSASTWGLYTLVAGDVITAIFFFAGFIAAATIAGGCGSLSGTALTACRCLSAGTAFGAFSWVLWTATSVLSIVLANTTLKARVANQAPVTTGVPVVNPTPTLSSVEAGIPVSLATPAAFATAETAPVVPMAAPVAYEHVPVVPIAAPVASEPVVPFVPVAAPVASEPVVPFVPVAAPVASEPVVPFVPVAASVESEAGEFESIPLDKTPVHGNVAIASPAIGLASQ